MSQFGMRKRRGGTGEVRRGPRGHLLAPALDPEADLELGVLTGVGELELDSIASEGRRVHVTVNGVGDALAAAFGIQAGLLLSANDSLVHE
jgi:hypothetical protein